MKGHQAGHLPRHADDLIAEAKRAGCRPVLVSGGGLDFTVLPLARYLDIPDVIANSLEFEAGYATGRLGKPFVAGATKSVLMQDFARKHSLDLAQSWAYSRTAQRLPHAGRSRPTDGSKPRHATAHRGAQLRLANYRSALAARLGRLPARSTAWEPLVDALADEVGDFDHRGMAMPDSTSRRQEGQRATACFAAISCTTRSRRRAGCGQRGSPTAPQVAVGVNDREEARTNRLHQRRGGPGKWRLLLEERDLRFDEFGIDAVRLGGQEPHQPMHQRRRPALRKVPLIQVRADERQPGDSMRRVSGSIGLKRGVRHQRTHEQ